VRVDRDAAAVVATVRGSRRLRAHLDPRGVAGDGLVHGVVEDFGEEVVQARSSVPPIYMPGRRRTGSSPSSTSIRGQTWVSAPTNDLTFFCRHWGVGAMSQ
jgi:hypothetical protein